jgi:hypothetical protein
MIEEIQNHIEQAKARLLEQYKESPLINSLVEAFTFGLQDIEDIATQIRQFQNLDNATGATLDREGSIAGRTRVPGETDDIYREAIRNQIIQNLNEGTPNEVIDAARFFLGATDVFYGENYPAAVTLFTDVDIPDFDVPEVEARLKEFLPAGVSLILLGVGGVDAFRFGSGPGFGVGTFGKVFSTTPLFQMLTEDNEQLLTEDDELLLSG